MNINIFKSLKISLIAIIGGLLGAYAGADQTSKNWRRIGIPILITIIAFITLKNLLTLILLGLFIPFIMGYGIPCHNDSGSSLGRFWYDLIKETNPTLPEIKVQTYANIPTRGTIGLLMSLICICLPIITGNWLLYIICSLGIISTNALISWKDLGVYRLFDKQLLWSETVTYGLITLFITTTIFF